MSAIENATPKHPSRSGGHNVKDLMLAAGVVFCVVASGASFYGQASSHDKVRAVIEQKVLAAGGLESCSVLIGTQRHEGQCGAFSKYTVLSGGSELYVFEGPSHENPRILAGQTFWGFRVTEELRKFALDK